MANNPVIFNAVFSGVTGGVQSRWIDRSITSVLNAAIGAIATLVDSLIPAASFSTQDGQLMQSIAYGIYKDRYPTGTDLNLAQQMVNLFNSLRGSMLNTSSITQANWFIDPTNGNDFNSGETASSALKTASEFSVRTSYKTFDPDGGSMAVTALEDLPAGDTINVIGSRLVDNKILTVQGTLTELGEATISLVTPNATTANAPWLLTTTGFDWTTVNPAETRLDLANGAVSFVQEVIDANNVRVKSFVDELVNDNVTPVAAQVLTVSTCSAMETLALDVQTPETNPQFFFLPYIGPPVRVRGLALTALDVRESFFQSAQLFGCYLPASAIRGLQTLVMRGCSRDSTNGLEFAVRDTAKLLMCTGNLYIDTALAGSLWFPNSPELYMRGRTCTRGCSMFPSPFTFMEFSGGGGRGTHCEDWNGSALFIGAGSRTVIGHLLTGTSAAAGSVGITITASGRGTYGSTTKPTVAGVTDTSIGGSATAYAAVPFIEPANNAALVVSA